MMQPMELNPANIMRSLVIPEDFTKDMMSVFTSDVTHPQIIYYINEKENAIAPKVLKRVPALYSSR